MERVRRKRDEEGKKQLGMLRREVPTECRGNTMSVYGHQEKQTSMTVRKKLIAFDAFAGNVASEPQLLGLGYFI